MRPGWHSVKLVSAMLVVGVALGAFVLFEIGPDGCFQDLKVIGYVALGAIAFAVFSTLAALTFSASFKRARGVWWKLAVVFLASCLWVVACGRYIVWTQEAIFRLALPLIDAPGGLDTCLAHFTPNYLHAGDELFRALMAALPLSIALVNFPWERFRTAVVRFRPPRS